MDAEQNRVVKNSDNDELLPCGDKGLVFGYTNEVNGPGAEELKEFVVTRHELIQIVKYWAERRLGDSWDTFVTGDGINTTDFYQRCFAKRRIARAERALGKEAVDKAFKEVEDEFKAGVKPRPAIDARLWGVFVHGTEEQRAAVQEEFWRKMREKDAERALKELDELKKQYPYDCILFVLNQRTEGGDKPTVIAPADSQLTAVLRASPLQIETDASKIKTLIVDQKLTEMGFILGKRQKNGNWLFEFPRSQPGTVGWSFLDMVARNICKFLRVIGKESQRFSISS